MISEPVLIRLFYNSFQPFIYAQTKQNGHWKDTWEQAIKKAITVEVKAVLNFPFWVQIMDAYYS